MADNTAQEDTKARSMNFVEEEVWNDLQAGRNGGRINTRLSLIHISEPTRRTQ